MSCALKLVITFQKYTADALYVKEKAKQFFSEFHQYDNLFDARIAEPKNIDIDSVYAGDVYEIDVTLMYSTQQNLGDLFSKIIQDWCNPLKNDLSGLWLRIANISCLENKGKLCHPDAKVREIAFGTFPDMQHFMQHYHYESNQEEMMSTFLHSQRKFMVYTCFIHDKQCKEEYVHNKFQIFYQSVSYVIVNYIPDKQIVQLFFHLQHVPLLYISKNTANKEKYDDESVLACDQEYQAKKWDRTLDFGCKCKRTFCSIEKIGKCPVFKVTLFKKRNTHCIIERLMQRCPSGTLFHFTALKTVYPKIKLKDFEQFPFNIDALKLYSDKNVIADIQFKCQFAWEVIICKSLELRDQIILKCNCTHSLQHWEDLKQKLKSFFAEDVDALVQSLYDISELINKNFLFSFDDALIKLYSHHHKNIEDKTIEAIPDGMCLVRRIIISPARIVCLPPSEHFDNRVIREYGAENLLRVSVQDDDFSKLTFAVQYHSRKREFMERVVKKILLDGIGIGPRKYEILAASNSQLREHGIWMYAKDHKGNTAESIRKWMGDFSRIKNVPKYMARMGQCFSTSDESVQIELKEDEVSELPDIETEDGKYKFTDGVGLISEDLADEVRYAYAQRNNTEQMDMKCVYDPSAFQIRFGGCKGMVSESKILKGRKIAIRPSMNKFPCSSSVLEVVKISAPRPVFLNRPFITILENLGINESVFMELQKNMVFDLTDSLIYERKARKMLENNTSLEFPFKKLYNTRISLSQEPFFRRLLLSVYKSLIGKLKCKTRIAISPKYGRNMMGIVDETGTLKYGEIFAQYSQQVSNFKSKTKVLKGTVVVTKNPCMHPGDVRKFNAVDVPQLRHIKDCIVFPAQGKRPHPDEMAGSDLDGDEYVLIWDPNLIFPQKNYPAMNYPPNEAIKLNRPIQVKDMVDFFCTYIENDSIGIMANAHLAWADKLEEGVFSKVCMEIARKYPLALDFAKSGTTCTLHSSERPKLYPDFMEKGSRNNSYKSTKSLGLLYRVIRSLEASVSNINIDVPVAPDPKFEVPGWEIFEELAEQRRKQYIKRLNSVLKKYGLQSEAEALTGYVDKMNEYNSNKYDSENIVSLSKKYFMDTIKRYRMIFFQDCSEKKFHSMEKKEIVRRMASAWYMVTYKNKENSSILSFPWIVSDILCDIKNGDTETEEIVSKSIFIDECNKTLQSLNLNKEIGSCPCVAILCNILMDWVKKSSFILTKSADDIFCNDCFERIIRTFRESVMRCCSNKNNKCTCSKACSPMKLVLECFKYYASGINPNLGACGNQLSSGSICEGFRDINLQSLALKTYAAVAITRNLKFLGLMNDNVPEEDDCNEEGDPIRVPVTAELEEILMGNIPKVREVLKKLTNVKEINIDGNTDKKDNYILVQSVGKPFQRWNLEELIMDAKCPSIIKSKIQDI